MPERLFLGGEHGVPGGEHDGLLVEHGADVGGDVFLLQHNAEHVFVEPVVGHDEEALVAVAAAPAVLDHPFEGLAVLVEVDGAEGHGVAGSAGEGADTLLLVHAEGGAEE